MCSDIISKLVGGMFNRMLKVVFHLYVKCDRGFVQVGTSYVQGGMFNESIVGREVQGL